MLQSWDELREKHDALMRLLDRDWGIDPHVQMRRWRRRFWWLLALDLLCLLLVAWFLLLVLANT